MVPLFESSLFGFPLYLNVWIPFWLEPFDEAIHRDLDHVVFAVTPDAPFAVLDPPVGREICGFCNVEARVEAAMVAQRKCDHEFALFLYDLQNKNLKTKI